MQPGAQCCGYEEAGGGIELCDIRNTSERLTHSTAVELVLVCVVTASLSLPGLTDCHQCLNKSASQTVPTPTEFIEYLPLFKDSIPNENCDQG